LKRDDIERLKAETSLASVIQECGLRLESDGRYYVAVDYRDPPLRVDDKRGRFEWGEMTGDVIDFLKTWRGWDFGQVLNYLQNRSRYPPMGPRAPDRPAGGAASNSLEAVVGVLAPVDTSDNRIRRAYELAGYECREHIDRALNSSWVNAILMRGEIPTRFESLAGDWLDESCCNCGCELGISFPDPQVFRAVEIGENYELVTNTAPGAGLYCLDCALKFIHLGKALDLVINYLVERDKRRAGVGVS
jgi:hypothetical protein